MKRTGNAHTFRRAGTGHGAHASGATFLLPFLLSMRRTVIVGNVQAYLILDEFILAGEIQETSKAVILNRLAELNMMEI